ncbi:hypothetical protein PSTG_14496 [Puccinia striiformis f. sp. tritici PST-78]|uniref:uracil phosphoribosyltransferase n=1 Tax=Puccinia striiformis f. sp. tritici PST-78 TaxID=1165861 RepID=A0A0L0UYX7_9BASI|nr:hypothetical protein PSTG_14496 [Puccinia striiformis f. sp. tritici PST-78]
MDKMSAIIDSTANGIVRSHSHNARTTNSREIPNCSELPSNSLTLTQTTQLDGLMTILRDRKTPRSEFIFTADRVIRLLVEEGLNHLPVESHSVEAPTGAQYKGVRFLGKICGVSIMRAGESMEAGLRDCCRSVRIGKILIQRDEETALPKLFYAKLPDDIQERYVLLLDPMLATGGSAIKAIEVLIEHGVPEDRILFLNLVAAPEGLANVFSKHSSVKVVSAWVDEGLDENKYIIPGLGGTLQARDLLNLRIAVLVIDLGS